MSAGAEPAGWEIPGGGWSFGGGITTSATAITHFSTDCNLLGLRLTSSAFWNYASYEQDMGVTLKDLTAAATLLNVAHLDDLWGREANQYFTFGIDPSHQYELTISGWLQASDLKYVDMGLQVALLELNPRVPEPPSPLVTGALAAILFGFGFFRSRFV